MGSSNELKDILTSLAEEHASTWQQLPESFDLPKPLPIKAVLRKHKGRKNDTETPFATPQDAVWAALEDGAKIILLEGGPGQGKTSAMRWAAHLKSVELAESDYDLTSGIKLPWFENLGRLTQTGDGQATIEGIINGRSGPTRGLHGLFFLDGLDLLIDRPDPSSLIAAANNFARDGGHAFVFSSRPLDSVRGVMDEWGRSYRIELVGLDQNAVEEWLQACETKHPGFLNALGEVEKANEAAKHLRNSPLLLAMMVSSAISAAGGQEPLQCNSYPGRAGLFAGFISHLINRAQRQKHLRDDYHYKGQTLAGLCWAALTAGHLEEIPGTSRDELLQRAVVMPGDTEPLMPKHTAESLADEDIDGLRNAGVIFRASANRTIRFIHQEFMEHLGGRHLARRIQAALKGGWLDAELWDHLVNERLDTLLAHAIAQMNGHDRQVVMYRAFDLLDGYSMTGRAAPLSPADPTIAFDLVSPYLVCDSYEVRRAAAEALGEVKDNRAVDELIKALSDDHEAVRGAAAWALGEIKGNRAVDELIKALSDDHEDVRWATALALGELKDNRAMDELIKALNDDHVDVRRAAAGALGELKDNRAVDALIKALNHDHEDLRRAAADALGEIKDSRVVDELIKALNHDHEDVRGAVARALGEIKDNRAVDALIKALSGDHDEYVRRAATWALGELKDNRAVDELIKALKDDHDEYVRGAAAWALGELKDNRVVDELIKALSDDHEDVRWTSALALGELKDNRAVDELIKALNDDHEDVRRSAADALGDIKDNRAVDGLIKALYDDHETVLWAAADALGEIKDNRAVDALIKALSGDHDEYVRGAAARALGEIKDNRAVDALIKALSGDHDEEVRWAAALALGDIKDARAVDELIKALSDDHNEDVRRAAIWALGELKDNRAVDELIKALSGDHDEEVRWAAADALGELKDNRAVDELIKTLNDDHRKEVRWYTTWALARRLAQTSEANAMEQLQNCADKIPDDTARLIVLAWRMRWPGKAKLAQIGDQKLKRMIAEKSMSKSGDTINQYGNTGQTVGKVEGDNYYNDPGMLLQTIETIRADIASNQTPVSQSASNTEVIDKLDELSIALQQNNTSLAKQAWDWLHKSVAVAQLSDLTMKYWPALEKAFS